MQHHVDIAFIFGEGYNVLFGNVAKVRKFWSNGLCGHLAGTGPTGTLQVGQG